MGTCPERREQGNLGGEQHKQRPEDSFHGTYTFQSTFFFFTLPHKCLAMKAPVAQILSYLVALIHRVLPEAGEAGG